MTGGLSIREQFRRMRTTSHQMKLWELAAAIENYHRLQDAGRRLFQGVVTSTSHWERDLHDQVRLNLEEADRRDWQALYGRLADLLLAVQCGRGEGPGFQAVQRRMRKTLEDLTR